MSFRRSEATRNLRAGGRSVILAKAKSSFLFDGGGSEPRRGDPARQLTKML